MIVKVLLKNIKMLSTFFWKIWTASPLPATSEMSARLSTSRLTIGYDNLHPLLITHPKPVLMTTYYHLKSVALRSHVCGT